MVHAYPRIVIGLKPAFLIVIVPGLDAFDVLAVRAIPPKSTVVGEVCRKAFLLTSLPVNEMGNIVEKPAMAFTVVSVKGVDLIPGLVFP